MQKLPSATGVTRTGKEIGGKKFRVGAGDEYVPFRSRTKRRRRMITAGVIVLLLIGAGAYGVVSLTGSPSSEAKAASGCPASGTSGTGKAAASASGSQNAAHVAVAANGKLPAANQITLNVYNATERQGLAHGVANQLKQRGFKVGQIINDPLKATVTAAAQIRAGASGASAMRVVAAEVTGAQLRPDTRPDSSVDLVLGSGFNALASPDQVSAALKAITDAAKAAAAKNACS